MKKFTKYLSAFIVFMFIGAANADDTEGNGNGTEPPGSGDTSTQSGEQATKSNSENEGQTAGFCDTFPLVCDLLDLYGNGNGTEPPG